MTGNKKIHIDTDFGGDIDDFCAISMLLGWPSPLEITGITTVGEEDGRRAGFLQYMFNKIPSVQIPFASGIDVKEGNFRFTAFEYPPNDVYWPGEVHHYLSAPGEAEALLLQSVEAGATLIGIGPYSNLARLEKNHPGSLAKVDLVLMGGLINPIPRGFPQLGLEADWNMQTDVDAALYVLEHSDPLLVPLEITLQTAFTQRDIPDLQKGGAIGNLLAHQAKSFMRDQGIGMLYGFKNPKISFDFVNFLHDPLASAIACGWKEGLVIEELPLSLLVNQGYLQIIKRSGERKYRVVTQVNTAAFHDFWLECIVNLQKLGA